MAHHTYDQPVTYRLAVTNTGPCTAVGVVIRDPLPAGQTFLDSADGRTAAAGTLTCPVGAPSPGAGRTASFCASTLPGGQVQVRNTARVSADTPDLEPANNEAT